MQEITQLAVAFVVMVVAIIGGAIALKNAQGRVAITGVDFDSGQVRRRMCKINKDGNAVWKGPQRTACELVLEKDSALQGRKTLEYMADVSHGQGLIMTLASATELVRMNGWRLYEAGLRAGLKEIAAASGNNLEKMLMMILVAVGVVALVLIGGIVYLVKVLNAPEAGGVV